MKTTLLLVLVAFSACASVDLRLMRPALGDARRSIKRADVPFLVTNEFTGATNRIAPFFQISAPVGTRHDVTFCFWARCYRPGGAAFPVGFGPMVHLNYTPEVTREPVGDLTSGAFGWPFGTNFTGTLSAPFTFSHPTNVPSTVFPRGVYNARGFASNEVTLSAGGKDITLPIGEFSINFEPGEADDLILSGAGVTAVAIARPRVHQFFGTFQVPPNPNSQSVAGVWLITNEVVFVSCRIHLDNTNHYTACTLWRRDWEGFASIVQTNSLPADPSVRALDRSGLFQFALLPIAPAYNSLADLFDIRAFPRRLSDRELERIYLNGAAEMDRRNIPRWRTD